jgi:diaminobutyrate-2-oxoglutarate transaminase
LTIFERRESNVRSYCRAFPAVFVKGKDAFLFDDQGKRYIDFFSGAGALNYGHNPARMKAALVDYVQADGIVHGLDMATVAKQRFLERFESVVLKPRGLDHKVQFCGPTGTNAIEAALKLARRVKQRSNVVAFTNAYHGLTSGALSVTGSAQYRNEAFVNRQDVSFMPYDGYLGAGVNTVDYLAKCIEDESSGLDLPAAVVLETVQAEGGVNVAGDSWLRDLGALCARHDILLIVDDIQVGCGRTGPFFSFERAGITPDMVTLSKSISGFGLPMALVLIRPEFDQWRPGEHTGTFRGNNLAFVTGTEALHDWETPAFSASVVRKGERLAQRLEEIADAYPKLGARVRGLGLIYGLDIANPGISGAVAREAFRQGLVIEQCGEDGRVLKFLPPLTIDDEVIEEGLDVVDRSIREISRQ